MVALTVLLNEKVGDPFPDDKLSTIYKQGEKRYAQKVPPGYEDANKEKGTENRSYGDLVLWFQIIEYARKNDSSIIFITDDRKDDWWHKSKGKIIGPRPELVNEIHHEAGIEFYMYSSDRFMEYAREHLTLEVAHEAIDEVKVIREADEEVARSLISERRRERIYHLLNDLSKATNRPIPDILSSRLEMEASLRRHREAQALWERSQAEWALWERSQVEWALRTCSLDEQALLEQLDTAQALLGRDVLEALAKNYAYLGRFQEATPSPQQQDDDVEDDMDEPQQGEE